MQHNLIGAACIHNGTPEECTAGMASQRNVNDCLAKSSADLPAVQDEIDDRPRCVDDTISTFRHDDNWNCDASCVEQSAVLLSSSAPSSATKPAAAELLAAASGAEATSARASAQPRASVLIATRQRRRSSIGDFLHVLVDSRLNLGVSPLLCARIQLVGCYPVVVRWHHAVAR